MNPTLQKALYVILISLGLALMFNYLFFGMMIGISLLIFVSLLLFAVFLSGLQNKLSMKKTWWLVLLIAFFALMPTIRANEFLTFLNVCATFGLLLLLAHDLTGTPAFVMKLWDYIILLIGMPLRMIGRAASTVAMLGQIRSSDRDKDVWIRVFKGVIMAVPILILFGVLFSQADLAFSQFVKKFVDITISERTIQHTVLIAFAFIASLGFLSYIFFPKPIDTVVLPSDNPTSEVKQGKGIEVLVFLGLIAALFLVFIGFQITYLFGGETNIINAGFTYAEYARRGFWELLAVAMLSLLVLLASEKYAGVETKTNKQFLIPSLILIAEVIIVIVSAFKRLSLYIDTYGMTDLRFYVAGFIMLLLVLFVILAVKFIKSKQEQFFAFGTLLSVAGFLIVVNLVNPDAFIVKSNLARYNETGKIDAFYIGTLSADAQPWQLEIYKKLEGEDKNELRDLLLLQKDRLEKSNKDWQSANFSRDRALEVLQEL